MRCWASQREQEAAATARATERLKPLIKGDRGRASRPGLSFDTNSAGPVKKFISEKANRCSPCRFLESAHTIEILLMRAVPIGLRLRVHASWTNGSDRLGDIMRAKSSC